MVLVETDLACVMSGDIWGLDLTTYDTRYQSLLSFGIMNVLRFINRSANVPHFVVGQEPRVNAFGGWWIMDDGATIFHNP